MAESGPRRRRRATRRRVWWAERASRFLITTGGIGTIAAVCGILVFLVWVVLPLFHGATVEAADVRARTGSDRVVHLAADEAQRAAVLVHADGAIEVVPFEGPGAPVRRAPASGPRPTAWSFGTHGSDVAVGYEDGTVRLGRLTIPEADPTQADLALDPPIPVSPGKPVRLLDHAATSSGTTFVAWTEDERLLLVTVSVAVNQLTDERTVESNESLLPFEPRSPAEAPAFLGISGVGDTVFLAWADGRLVRYDARDRDHPKVAEVLDLVEKAGSRLTALGFVIGKTTLVAGDSDGRSVAWFTVRQEGTVTSDGTRLVPAHVLPGGSTAVSALAPSARSHLFAVGHTGGTVRLVYVTSQRTLLEENAGGEVEAIAIAPKDDGLLALVGGKVHRWRFEAGHPEAGFRALFGKVWYEGSPEPQHVWQSTGGSDFEPKFGLVPLIFGTAKATFYSMLFGVPLAILAAIFTSEFLHSRVRTSVKSTIEIMASLPSVVLGFLAAIVVAPFVQRIVPTVLAAFLTVPFAFMFGAALWQLLPQSWSVRLAGAPRFAAMCVALPLGILAAAGLGPWIETQLFEGDLLRWLSDRKFGGSFGGWAMILLPFGAVAAAIAVVVFAGPVLRRRSLGWSRGACAVADLGKLMVGALFAIGVAFGLAALLSWAGTDPRGTFVDTYVQRNALVVGFLMGFAIIPIVYTLAEDALSSVPRHLREASLGAGATPWQTAIRVVVPTALSGLFSALMIGLGRAVGETMIVLMAAGNTPILDWNPVNGMRTLSANTATEMAEAAVGGTHYRTLFLAALCLFAMTFVLNTVAEAVRQRFRRRAFQL